MIEGKADIEIEGVFYNKWMELSRNLSIEVIKKIPGIKVLDAFSASGVRGIRYKLEANVEKVDFLDISKKAVDIIKRNLNKNGIDGNVFRSKFEDFQNFNDYDFIEIDPFGSPSAYIPIVISRMKKKIFYLSVTATDTAVSCGKFPKACMRYYLAKPLLDKSCHETALRILIGYIARIGWIYNYNTTPLMSFYYRHQIKTIVKMQRGFVDFSKIGYLKLKNKQKYISKYGYGPIWLDNYYQKEYINPNYPIMKIISEELSIPYHYDIHEIASYLKAKELPKIEEILSSIKASRTHFSPTGIKTEEYKEFLELFT